MKYLYVANWKMNMTFDESIYFAKKNNDTLQQLATKFTDIVICPSFVAIAPLANIFKNSPIAVGAQNCSEHPSGAYTGEVSVLSLIEAGVTYCIVGHSERRMQYGETTESIAQKIYLLYASNIMPIICIGESHTDFLDKKTFEVLTEQLNPILTAIAQQQEKTKQIIIAYEPVWAIGTGITPTQEQLTAVFAWITEQITLQLPEHSIHLLYGGSVNKNNSAALKKTPLINGFLIGGASTDFEQLKDIITQ